MPGIISPARSVQNNSCCRISDHLGEPNLVAVEAIMAPDKSSLLYRTEKPLFFRKAASIIIATSRCAPGRCLLSLTPPAASDWRALSLTLTLDITRDELMQRRNVETRARVSACMCASSRASLQGVALSDMKKKVQGL